MASAISKMPKANYNILPLEELDSWTKEFCRGFEELKQNESFMRHAIDRIRDKELDSAGADVFIFLRLLYKFQDDNVKNQREHLAMLLKNRELRNDHQDGKKNKHQISDSIHGIFNDTFFNYEKWCAYLKTEPSFRRTGDRSKGLELLLVSLYYMIWGEASNLRFMPECLCYIFHQLSNRLLKEELGGFITDQFTFLAKVVQPTYNIIAEEANLHKKAVNNNTGRLRRAAVSHAAWRNYDDLNEFFWSPKCLRQAPREAPWDPAPMLESKRANDHHALVQNVKNSVQRLFKYNQRKTLFVEHRSFLHIYHSFHRLWTFNVLLLQALAILAFDRRRNLKFLLSLGPTYALMQFFQSSLEVLGICGAYDRSPVAFLVRIYLRFFYFGGFSAALTYTYLKIARENVSTSTYLVPYVIIMAIFTSVQVCIYWFSVKYLKEEYYVGRGMRQSPLVVCRYVLFWTAVLVPKFFFSYFFQIEPLAGPTKAIIKARLTTYEWYDLISQKNNNALSIVSIWAPVIMVYFLDTQIWYTVISAFVGCFNGGRSHIGEIRSLDMFSEKFKYFPENFRKTMVTPLKKDESDREHSTTVAPGHRFEPYWNRLVTNLREEDYLNDQEKDYLWMPESEEDIPTQWPLFLLLEKVQLVRSGRKDTWTSSQIRDGVRWCLRKLTSCRGNLEKVVSDDNDQAFENSIQIVAYLANELSDPDSAPGSITVEGCTITIKTKRTTAAVIAYVRRLHTLLTSKFSASGIPSNREAIRRLVFFGNSLLMKMPKARPVKEMLSFSVLTPHYDEEIMYNVNSLEEANKDGITLLYYLQTIFPGDWLNFLQRRRIKELVNDLERLKWDIPFDSTEGQALLKRFLDREVEHLKEAENSEDAEKCQKLNRIRDKELNKEELNEEEDEELEKLKDWIRGHKIELCKWASYRGQTLARTVRGIMYYREAIELQQGQDPTPYYGADAKFTYVVSSQKYADFLSSSNKPNKATQIDELMKSFPSLRIAFFNEETINNKKMYFSNLIKYDNDAEDKEVKIIYRIQLPGDPKVGEGKPENQNHAIIFTRGDAIQAIDMNQDNYFEEALKMRNLLEEFKKKKQNRTILGLREHIFTGSISSLAWFMSNQELSFVTLGQRVMASPLRVRMHYGHPDVFDRIFHITRGGISKASKTINLSEDIFAGFNSTLRGGTVTHHEYIQVGKGRDLGLNQISTFEAKISSGNGEQLLSRDVYRLGRLLDFFRMMSFYYTSVGYYVSVMLTLWSLYAYLYGKVYLALSGVERELLDYAKLAGNRALESALSAQLLFQIGAFTCLPMVLEYFLEYGFSQAVENIVMMQLTLSAVFFVFSLGTRSHYFGRTVLHGGAKYGKTGRGFVIEHISFAENYRLYSRSHFVYGLEIVMLLIVYRVYGTTRGISYILMSIGNWFVAISWLFAPYLFNPLGFEWQKTVEDMRNWSKWLQNTSARDNPSESWLAWWEEQYNIRTLRSMFWETLLSLRFLMIQYGVSFQLAGSQSPVVYLVSWLAFFLVCGIISFMLASSRSSNKMRTVHALASLLIVASVILGSVFTLNLKVQDVLKSILAMIPTFWGLLSVGAAWKPIFYLCGPGRFFYNRVIRGMAWVADAAMGYVIFAPVAFFSYFPFISPLQTRILFNTEFSRGMEISVLLSGNRPVA